MFCFLSCLRFSLLRLNLVVLMLLNMFFEFFLYAFLMRSIYDMIEFFWYNFKILTFDNPNDYVVMCFYVFIILLSMIHVVSILINVNVLWVKEKTNGIKVIFILCCFYFLGYLCLFITVIIDQLCVNVNLSMYVKQWDTLSTLIILLFITYIICKPSLLLFRHTYEKKPIVKRDYVDFCLGVQIIDSFCIANILTCIPKICRNCRDKSPKLSLILGILHVIFLYEIYFIMFEM